MAGSGEMPVTYKEFADDYWNLGSPNGITEAMLFDGPLGDARVRRDYQRYLDAFEEESQPPATVEP